MKEYICKEDLAESRQDFMDTVYDQLYNEPDNVKANYIIDAYDLSVDNLPTVTKADICREFANWCYLHGVDFSFMGKIKDGKSDVKERLEKIVNSYLAEMESEKD